MNVTPVTLVGEFALLEPLREEHAEGLFAVGAEPEIWKYMLRPALVDCDDTRQWIRTALTAQASGSQLPFAIIERASGRVAGSTRFLNISLIDRGLEIGFTWLGRDFRRTALNTECKLLLMRHAFETLGCVRVQLKTDERNERSRRAIERLGCVFEGVLRKYQLSQHDYYRNTALYSTTNDEWCAVRERLEALLRR